MKERFTVGTDLAGERLDAFIAKASSLSRSAAQKAIEDGRVTVDGKAAVKKLKVTSGMMVEIEIEETLSECDAIPEDIPLDIVYEDSSVIVINKPKGMVVHPAAGNYTGTLVNALLFHCKDSLSGIGGVARPGIVHRIDKDTSGLLVVAKNDAAHTFLSDLLKLIIAFEVVCRNGRNGRNLLRCLDIFQINHASCSFLSMSVCVRGLREYI